MDFSKYSKEIIEYVDAIHEYRGYSSEDLLYVSEKLMEEGKKLKDSTLICYAGYHIGISYYINGNTDKAVETLNTYLILAQKDSIYEIVARSYTLLGILYAQKNNLPNAIDCYFFAKSICHDHGYSFREGYVNYNIGNLYFRLEDYKTAISYFTEALRLYDSDPNDIDYQTNNLIANSLLGICYCKLEDIKKAAQVNQILTALLSMHPSSKYLCSIYVFFSFFHHLEGDLSFRNKAIKLLIAMPLTEEDFVYSYEDFFRFCDFMLDINELEFFKSIYAKIVDKAAAMNNYNVTKKMIALRLKYYEITGEVNENFYSLLDEFHDVSLNVEKEEHDVISEILNVRLNFEKQRKSHRKLKEKEEQLRLESELDALTGIPNRYRFTEFSNIIYEQAYHENKQFAVEIFDIDYFKKYNDTYGHQKGDEILRSIGNILKNMASDKIFVSRYGGDEFVIIYYNMTKGEVFKAASNLRNEIVNSNMEHTASLTSDRITVSQGIFLGHPTKKLKLWDFMYFADSSLYVLKKSCRNSIHLTDEPKAQKPAQLPQ